ncbi:MAG: hypothetical protein SynsKO_37940 [Synoicihabitans sp.]
MVMGAKVAAIELSDGGPYFSPYTDKRTKGIMKFGPGMVRQAPSLSLPEKLNLEIRLAADLVQAAFAFLSTETGFRFSHTRPQRS